MQDEIQYIANQLIEKYKPEKIILFGSAVYGRVNENSDLDFLLIKKNVPRYGYQRMQEVRKLVEKNYPADFLVYTPSEFNSLLAKNEPFLSLIVKQGKTLYG